MKIKILLIVFILSTLTSCVAVKGYEMVNINDPDMPLADKKENKFKSTFQAYREGSSGASGGKTGGGCGCN